MSAECCETIKTRRRRRTSLGRLRLEYLDGLAGAEEGADEVHVDGVQEGLERGVLDGDLWRGRTCVL